MPHRATVIYLLLSLMLTGCNDFAGATEPSARQMSGIVASEEAWGELSSPCTDRVRRMEVIVGSADHVDYLCGSPVFACYFYEPNIMAIREAFVGTPSEITLSAHETIHLMAQCTDRDPDNSHIRQGLWIMPGVCLENSVEGRARISLHLDGCDTHPTSNCC